MSTHVDLVVSGVIPATSVVVLQSAFGPMYGVLGCCVQSSDQCGAPIVQRVLGESVGGIEGPDEFPWRKFSIDLFCTYDLM